MELIINIDDIHENAKSEWLFRTLNLMGIRYKTKESPQTIEEYNDDLSEGDKEIEQGHFITAADLKKKLRNGSDMEPESRSGIIASL